jgi:hypothetical protein
MEFFMKESSQTMLYVVYYIVGLIFSFTVVSICGLFAAAGILHLIAYVQKINI